jgi:hypothetical protein
VSKTAWWILWWGLSVVILTASLWAYPHVWGTLAAKVLMVVAVVSFFAQAVSICVVIARVITWPVRHARRSA